MVPPATSEDYAEMVFSWPNQVLLFMLGVLALMALGNWFGRTRGWRVATWPGRLSLPLIALAFAMVLVMGRDPDWSAPC